MEDKKMISYIAFEAAQARSERRERRFIVALIIEVGILFASNFVWLWRFVEALK